MKRILILLLCLSLLLLCACTPKSESQVTQDFHPQDESTQAPTDLTENSEPSVDDAPLLAVSVPMTTDYFYTDDGAELFSYSSQYMKLAFPDEEVTQKITLEFLNRVDVTQNEVQNFLELAENDFAQAQQWIPYFYRVIYNPTRIDHSVLSLYGIQNRYSGGMHGDVSGIAVNYDMYSGDVLTFGSIMHPEAEKEDFIQLVLNELREIADTSYLYDDYETAVRQRLEGDENLYEDFYFTTTGLNFFFSPYELAPYSSGIIAVEIPYTELPGLLYDDYFPAERNLVDGSMKSDAYADIPLDQFNNIVEVNLEGNEELYILHATGTVEDVRITVTGDRMTVPDYTAFLAYELSDPDAVVLQLNRNSIELLDISYQSGTERYHVALS